jgi:hypothetical protein
MQDIFFLRFLHKTYNADNTWIDKRMRRTVEEENEQTANETKKSDYNQHTHRERERERERAKEKERKMKKLTSTNK